MEKISKTPPGSISFYRDKNKAPDQNGLSLRKKRKRSTPMEVLKAALFVLRLKSSKSKSKSIQANVASNFSWKGLVGSMRPMHLQSHESPPLAIEAKPAIMPEPESIHVGEQTVEAIMPLLSPMVDVLTRSPAFSISSYGSVSDMSQYESPKLNLEEIYVIKPSEEVTEEEWYDNDGGDEMIDAKAEEFIAHFYEQLRLQNLN
ncbi:hypothetical protein CRYUN_Cryun14cG0080400 [Craigia yunnanensis]